MPVCSYIIYPESGKCTQLADKLKALPSLEVQSDEDNQVLIAVSDTKSHREERDLQEHLKGMEEIQCLTLSFAAADDGDHDER